MHIRAKDRHILRGLAHARVCVCVWWGWVHALNVRLFLFRTLGKRQNELKRESVC